MAEWACRCGWVVFLTVSMGVPAATGDSAFLVGDLTPGVVPRSSVPTGWTPFKSGVVFSALSPDTGREPWISDGTPEGTRLLADIWPGSQDSEPHAFIACGEWVMFVARSPVLGAEPWISAGTPESTRLLSDLEPGEGSSSVAPIGTIGARVIFFSAVSPQGRRLWSTDGTPEGTIWLEVPFGVSDSARLLGAAGGKLLVASGFRRLWATDGTPAGTVPILELTDGRIGFPQHESPTLCWGDRIFFNCSTSSDSWAWTTDGTVDGTRALDEGRGAVEYIGTAEGVYFVRTDDNGSSEIWRTDGNRTEMVRGGFLRAGPWAAVDDRLLFMADDGVHGLEPWSTDGASCSILDDLSLGTGDSCVSWGDLVGGRRVFFASRSVGSHGFWATDGTVEGTSPIAALGDDRMDCGTLLGRVQDRLLWLIPGWQSRLAVTDGTGDGSHVLATVGGVQASTCRTFSLGARLVIEIQTSDVAKRNEWVSDGTPEGTSLFDDQLPAPLPDEVCLSGGRLFFSAIDDDHGTEPWVTDGTPEGTRLVVDIGPTVPAGMLASDATTLGDRLAFRGSGWLCTLNGKAASRVEPVLPSNFAPLCLRIGERLLYLAGSVPDDCSIVAGDGLSPGVPLVEQFTEAPQIGTWRWQPAVLDRTVVFAARVGAVFGLWSTDGTTEGTVLLKRFARWDMEEPVSFARIGDRLFFPAEDTPHGRELWATDGSPGGTVLLKDIVPGVDPSAPRMLTNLGGDRFVFFADGEAWASDGTPEGTVSMRGWLGDDSGVNRMLPAGGFTILLSTTGNVWVSNGTPEGTRVLPQLQGSSVQRGAPLGSRALIIARSSGVFGLWVTDGTPEGTLLLRDGTNAYDMAYLAGRGYFVPHDPTLWSLWATDGTVAGTIPISVGSPCGVGHLDIREMGDQVVFVASDDSCCRKLWRSDGTPAGTSPIELGVDLEIDQTLGFARGYLYFMGNDGVHGLEPWAIRLFPTFIRGDSNVSGVRDISDPIATLVHLLSDPEEIPCEDAADANDDGTVDISDPVFTLGFLFLGGNPPPEPRWSCETDPTPDALTCESAGHCD